METETLTLSGFGLDLDLNALSTNEVERRLKEFFSARIANPNPEELIYSVKELEEQFGDFSEYQFAKAAFLCKPAILQKPGKSWFASPGKRLLILVFCIDLP